jgi:hypothetical protein
MVFSSDTPGHSDIRFGFLDKNSEVYVEPYLKIAKDEKRKNIPVEYRSFVVDGKFVTSRSWVPDSNIPEEVIKITKETKTVKDDFFIVKSFFSIFEYILNQIKLSGNKINEKISGRDFVFSKINFKSVSDELL